MDYHLIFIIVTLFLFIVSIFLIWMIGTKESLIVSTLFLSLNQLFCFISLIGFISIGIVGYNESTGTTAVIGFTDMQMYYMVFFGMLWLNSLMLFICIFKYVRVVISERLDKNSR
jgi:hypothetical protein